MTAKYLLIIIFNPEGRQIKQHFKRSRPAEGIKRRLTQSSLVGSGAEIGNRMYIQQNK